MNHFAINHSAGNFREASRQLAYFMQTHGISSVLLGLSGGADSVLTLHLLASVSNILPNLRLGISHVNFNLRGRESLRDENFVRKLVDSYISSSEYPNLEINFYYDTFPTKKFARENHLSIEMAARELRHGRWQTLLAKEDYQFIVTGHHAGDNEETMLLNLLRGSSPHGLRGMQPLRDHIFRPLLSLYKEQILTLLADFRRGGFNLNLPEEDFVDDSTNASSDYRRNFIRNRILPLLEEKWEGLHTALQATIDLQTEAAEITDYAINNFLETCRDSKQGVLHWSEIKKFPAPVSLIYHWLKNHGMTTSIAKDVAGHIPCGDCLFDKETGKQWELRDRSVLITTADGLRLLSNDELSETDSNVWKSSLKIEKIKIDKNSLLKIKTASLDEVYLPNDPTDKSQYKWRKPAKGDRMKLFSKKHADPKSKLVSDILREAGVPAPMRDKIRMLCNCRNGEIIWIPGIRRGGADLLSQHDEFAFHITISQKK